MGKSKKDSPLQVHQHAVCMVPGVDGEDEAWIIKKSVGSDTWQAIAPVSDPETAHQMVDDLNFAQTVKPKVEDIAPARRAAWSKKDPSPTG